MEPDVSRARWRKSSYSGAANGTGGECVELAQTAVRDSKNPSGPVLVVSPAQLTAFVAAAKRGGFDGA